MLLFTGTSHPGSMQQEIRNLLRPHDLVDWACTWGFSFLT